MLKVARSLSYTSRTSQCFHFGFKATGYFAIDGQGSGETMSTTKSIDWEKIAQPYTPFQQYASRRSVVYGTKGGFRSPPE